MKKLIIIGAGGFGREVAWVAERINSVTPTWDSICFMDDSPELQGKTLNGCPVVGTVDRASEFKDAEYVCAVGSSRTRRAIIRHLKQINPSVRFATLIDPSVEMSRFVEVGEGSIICAHNILTVNISVGRHVIINLDCTVGHDARLMDYVTLYPSVNISGGVSAGECVELGTGCQVLQYKTIGNDTIVGAGAVVTKDLPSGCTAVGAPAKPIKFFESSEE